MKREESQEIENGVGERDEVDLNTGLEQSLFLLQGVPRSHYRKGGEGVSRDRGVRGVLEHPTSNWVRGGLG